MTSPIWSDMPQNDDQDAVKRESASTRMGGLALSERHWVTGSWWLYRVFRLGKIAPRNAVLSTIAQFIGAVLAPTLLLLVLCQHFTHPDVHHAATQPGPMGVWPAFWSEFVITFILMMVLLIAVNSQRLEKFAGLLASLLVGSFIVVESPLLGMSMNPARSFGSDFVRQAWPAIWLYFVAPVAVALLAAEVYCRFCTGRADSCIKLIHRHDRSCIFCDYHRGATYPVEDSEKKET